MTIGSPADCSLLLEIFSAISIYDTEDETVEWEVSSDPAHQYPYLLAPRQYSEQEIDPIRCTASIGTVEVGVIDKPTVPGNQTTGWMTARVHDLLGRRCRLRRWINEDIGYVTIADGPAGAPKLDGTYSAYRWAIRDTRETERKLFAFNEGGVCGIAPRGPIYGFGSYTDDDGDHQLLTPVLETPLTGVFQVSAFGDLTLGVVNLAGHYSGMPIEVDDANMVLDEKANDAIQITEVATDTYGCRLADVLWRLAGSSGEWNAARPVSPATVRQPFVGTSEALAPGYGDEVQVVVNYVTLFLDVGIPEGFPLASGDEIELVIRYRGPATEDFPYYIEGPLGEVLTNLYNGVYSLVPTLGIDGFSYDPATQNATADFISRIQYDPAAFALMVDQVMLRQTDAISNAREWTETALYAPSGWIPALDNDMKISPVSRNRPTEVDGSLILEDSVTVPTPNWGTGEQTVSQITYTYFRYFVPDPEAGIETAVDGLAIRAVTVSFKDAESELRYGEQPEEYDASAFSAAGDVDGLNIPGQLETANLMAQTAKFEVLDRYRAGVQSVSVTARRSRIPNVRVGDWVPWALVQFPDRTTGLRGSNVPAAQIISLRDDDCTWRTMVLEESEESAGEPGTAILLEKIGDEPGSGFGSLTVLSDEESY